MILCLISSVKKLTLVISGLPSKRVLKKALRNLCFDAGSEGADGCHTGCRPNADQPEPSADGRHRQCADTQPQYQWVTQTHRGNERDWHTEKFQPKLSQKLCSCVPELQVQQKLLSERSHISAFCGFDVGNRDCISVQAENMKELHNNGGNY